MTKWEDVKLGKMYGCLGYAFYEELSSNQVMGVYFQEVDGDLYNCAVCIMDNQEDCKRWTEGETKNITTHNGRCGLEGLAKAFKLIKWFIENRLPENCRLQVHGEGKRGSAYKFLKRIGFKTIFSEVGGSLYVYEKTGEGIGN